MKILVLNSGSSSQKSCLYDIGKTLPEHPPAPVWEGKIEWDGNQADVQVRNLQRAHLKDSVKVASRSHAIGQLLDTLWNGKTRVISAPSEIDVVGHRIVHGGKDFDKATAITPEVKSAIARMSTFAPLHNRWLCSTPAFTADCRNLPLYTLALMNGSHRGFAVTDFTESIISIARSAPRSSSEGICNR